jgi:hypothetical protein
MIEGRTNKWSNERTNHEINRRVDKMFDDEGWHVLCSVTGEKIPYTQLRYWHVERQQAYARPELIKSEDFGY